MPWGPEFPPGRCSTQYSSAEHLLLALELWSLPSEEEGRPEGQGKVAHMEFFVGAEVSGDLRL